MRSGVRRPIQVLYVLKYRFVQRNSITVCDSLITDNEIVGVGTAPGENHLAVSFCKLHQSGEVVDRYSGLSRLTRHGLDRQKELQVATLDL